MNRGAWLVYQIKPGGVADISVRQARVQVRRVELACL